MVRVLSDETTELSHHQGCRYSKGKPGNDLGRCVTVQIEANPADDKHQRQQEQSGERAVDKPDYDHSGRDTCGMYTYLPEIVD
jgi:hypothetical protein